MNDGKLIVLRDIFNLGTYMCVPGTADDITNGVRFGGSDLKISCTQGGLSTLDFQFMEVVGIVGIRGVYVGAVFGDYVCYEVLSPAQPIIKSSVSIFSGLNKSVSTPGYNTYEKLL